MAPFSLSDLQETTRLVKKLQGHQQNLATSQEYTIKPGKEEQDSNSDDENVHKVLSWKIPYISAEIVSDLPLLIRGFFVEYLEPGTLAEKYGIQSDEALYRLVARGYEKFFNDTEVQIYGKQWEYNLEHSSPPYTLSIKEDGALVLISALDEKTLFISTKHVPLTNSRTVQDVFPQKAYKWLIEKLSACGKTEADLAGELYERNITAIAELCDDTFQEHIVSYKDEKRGLYLHGIHLNVLEPMELSIPLVTKFAEKYGIHTIEYFQLDSWQSVRELREECSATGQYKGEYIEGFVLRTRSHSDQQQTSRDNSSGIPPDFEPTFMLKLKFKNGYKMWQDWSALLRLEIKRTKTLKTTKRITTTATTVTQENDKDKELEELIQSKISRYPETKYYYHFIMGLLDDDDVQFKAKFLKKISHVKVRDMYYEWIHTEEGRDYISNNPLY